jgi:Flp pilus assembly protein TadD
MIHHEWAAGPDGKVLAGTELEVKYAVGSGRNGRSYLIDRGGFLFQSPITWYPRDHRWDLSPDYHVQNQHFGRVVLSECLFCHANRANPVPAATNRYQEPIFQGEAIGCERCHGPGQLHVERRAKPQEVPGPDDTIVNPERLPAALREEVCHQCHLQTEQRVVHRGVSIWDYRPGLPLEYFLTDFAAPRKTAQGTRFVGQVEQVAMSRCFRESDGRLGCISCHDPHRLPESSEKTAYYRGKCLACHEDTPARQARRPGVDRPAASLASECRLAYLVRLQSSNNCTQCHMPATGTTVAHTSGTDHRILRRPDTSATRPGPRPIPNPAELTPVEQTFAAQKEVSRDLGVGLIGIMGQLPETPMSRQYAQAALPLLEQALDEDPKDWTAWEAKGDALRAMGQLPEALAAYRSGLAQQADSESLLHAAGATALLLNRLEESRTFLEQGIQVNPWNWKMHQLLGGIFVKAGEWTRAAGELRDSLRIQPYEYSERRKFLIGCLMKMGNRNEARAEFDTLLKLTPEARKSELRQWFGQFQR